MGYVKDVLAIVNRIINLSDEEEAERVHFLVGASRMGYAKDVLAIVNRIIKVKGVKTSPVSNRGW